MDSPSLVYWQAWLDLQWSRQEGDTSRLMQIRKEPTSRCWTHREWATGDGGDLCSDQWSRIFSVGDLVKLSGRGLAVDASYVWDGDALLPGEIGRVMEASPSQVTVRGLRATEDQYDARDIQAVRSVGVVEVLEPLSSDSQVVTVIQAGTKGVLLHYDEQGDALIQFEEILQAQWVFRERFSSLRWIEGAALSCLLQADRLRQYPEWDPQCEALAQQLIRPAFDDSLAMLLGEPQSYKELVALESSGSPSSLGEPEDGPLTIV